ncbi:MAG: hypothetical protein JWM55_723 [Acidimicrobiaceae bacterium]|nr:hypothetical protein [Acidimicrobiaceae bacterium]
MTEVSSSATGVMRAALVKIEPATVLANVDTLDLRAHARVSAVIGVPLRQLQQRRDVTAFATTAPVAAIRATLELLAMTPLETVIGLLGDHAESPTYEQLTAAIDAFVAGGATTDDVVALLAYAIGESFPAAAHCRRLLEERAEFALPPLPEVIAPRVLAAPREVSAELREQRRARREEEKRRKKPGSPSRPPRPAKTKGGSPPRVESPLPSPEVIAPVSVDRRQLVLTPLESSRFDPDHPLVGTVVLADVPYDAVDPDQPETTSKERPALVVAASRDEALVRPIYSNQSPSRSVFQPWRRVGLDHVSFIDDARVSVSLASTELERPLAQLTVEEWNAIS